MMYAKPFFHSQGGERSGTGMARACGATVASPWMKPVPRDWEVRLTSEVSKKRRKGRVARLVRILLAR
jgi:hypothetical protein